MQDRIKALEAENSQLRQNPLQNSHLQSLGRNPEIAPTQKTTLTRTRVREVPEEEREELLGAIEEAQKLLDDGRIDKAQLVFDAILDEYDVIDDEDEED